MNSCKFSPNGKESKIYKSLNDNLTAKQAEKVFLYVHSPEFKNNYGDWDRVSNESKFLNKLAINYGNLTMADLDKNTLEPNLKSRKLPKFDNLIEPSAMFKLIVDMQSDMKTSEIGLREVLDSLVSGEDTFNLLAENNIKELVNGDITPKALSELLNNRFKDESDLTNVLREPVNKVLDSIEDPKVKTLVEKATNTKPIEDKRKPNAISLGAPRSTTPLSIENRIKETFNLSFNDSVEVDEENNVINKSPVLNIPLRKHEYVKSDGTIIKTSVTKIKSDYVEYQADTMGMLMARMGRKKYKALNEELNKIDPDGNIKQELFRAAMDKSWGSFFNKYNKKINNDILMQQLQEVYIGSVADRAKWEATSVAGTALHRFQEAILKEDDDPKLNATDRKIRNSIQEYKEKHNQGKIAFKEMLRRTPGTFLGKKLISKDSPIQLFRMAALALEEGDLTQADKSYIENTFDSIIVNKLARRYEDDYEGFVNDFLTNIDYNMYQYIKQFERIIKTSKTYKKLRDREENIANSLQDPDMKYIFVQEDEDGNLVYPRLESSSHVINNPEDPNGKKYYLIDGFESMSPQEKITAIEKYNSERGDFNYLTKMIDKKFKPYTEGTSIIQFEKDLLEFKNYIHSKGGRILTEVPISTNKALSKNGKVNMEVAGMIDVLVIYEDREGVDPEYRGKVELYDLKTTKRKFRDKKGIDGSDIGFGQKKYPGKLSGYAFQLLLYSRILEEELGVEVKDAFLMPVHTPSLDMSNLNDIKYSNYQMQRFTKSTSEGQFEGTINIKDIKTTSGVLINNGGQTHKVNVLGYKELKARAQKRIPKIKTSNQDKQKEKEISEGEKIRNEIDKARTESELTKLMEDLSINVASTINRLRRSKGNEEALERIKKLENDLKELKTIQKVTLFAQQAYENIFGIKDKEGNVEFVGMLESFNTIINNHYDPSVETDLGETIKQLDEIRLALGDYDILDNIKVSIDNLSDGPVRDNIKKTEGYKNLTRTIEMRDKIKKDFMDHAAKLMAKQLVRYATVEGDTEIKQHFSSKTKRLKEKLDTLKALQAAGDQTVDYRIKNLENKIKRVENDIEKFTVDEASIEAALKRLPEDISPFARLLYAPGASSDAISALFAKMVKYKTYDSDLEIETKGIEMQTFLTNLAPDLGISMKGLNYGVTNSPKKFFAPMLETVNKLHIETVNNETKVSFRPTLAFVTPISSDDIEIELEDELGNIKKYKVDYTEADKYYKYILATTRDNDIKKFKKYKDIYENFKREYLERPYVKEYYEDLEKLDPLAKEAMEEINDKIDKLISDAGVSEFFLEGDDLIKYNQYEAQRRALRSEYDFTGNKKTGKELKIALALQEHNARMSKYRSYEQDKKLFEQKRSEASQLYADKPVKYYEWLNNNYKVNTTEKFKGLVWSYKVMSDITGLVRKIDFYEKHKDKFEGVDDIFSRIGTSFPRGIIDKFRDIAEDVDLTTIDENIDEIKALLEKNNLTRKDIIEADNLMKTELGSGNPVLGELFKEVNELKNAYKKDDKYDVKSMPDEVLAKIQEVEKKINTIINSSTKDDWIPTALVVDEADSIEEKRMKTDILSEYIEANSTDNLWRRELSELVESKPTKEYYAEYDKQEALFKSEFPHRSFETSDWYKNNHIIKKLKGDKNSSIIPISIWNRELPRDAIMEPGNLYKLHKEEELEKIRKRLPDASEEGLESEFKTTEFFKTYHDPKTGDLNELGNRMFAEPKEDDEYLEARPVSKFNRTEINEEYVRPEEDVYDSRGRLKPLPGKFKSKRYTELQKNKGMFKLYEELMKTYDEAKSKIPEFYDMGNTVPFLRIPRMERMTQDGKIGKNLKSWMTETVEGFGNVTDQDNIEGYANAGDVGIDKKFVPMQMTNYLPPEEQSHDVLSAMMQFFKYASRHNALNGILGESRTLVSLLENRDSQNQIQKLDSSGNPILDTMASRVGLKRGMDKGGPSEQAKLIIGIVETQLFNEMNIPLEQKFNFSNLSNKLFKPKDRSIRYDKVFDGVMGFASTVQIGGLSSAGILKGVANFLQASLQLHIETAARQYIDPKSWHLGKSALSTGRAAHNLMMDMGKLHPTSKIGQLLFHFDGVQGRSYDDFGREVSRKGVSKLASSSTWFKNQDIGELLTGSNTVLAMLHSVKVMPDGKTYNKNEYRAMKAKEKGHVRSDDGEITLGSPGTGEGDWSKLTELEIIEADKEWEAIENTLYDKISVDPKTKKLVVEEGVDWVFGSMRDKNLKSRIAAISENLNGAYATANKSMIQRSVFGRILLMYRKYLIPALRNRFWGISVDQQKGGVQYGYYRNALSLLLSDFPRLMKNMHNIVLNRKVETGFSEVDKASVRKAVREVAAVLALIALIGALKVGEDEDEDEITYARKAALYEAMRLKRETNALVPGLGLVKDNWKLLSSTSSIVGTIQKFVNVADRLISEPTAVYEKDPVGLAEKGDSKLIWDLRKAILGSTVFNQDVDQMNANMNRN